MQEALVLIAIVIGLAVGSYLVAQSPAFWIGVLKQVARELAPIVTKRMPPEDEEAWRKCQLRGGKWNERKRRCE